MVEWIRREPPPYVWSNNYKNTERVAQLTNDRKQGLESLLGKDDELVQEVKRLDSDMQVRAWAGG